MSSWQKRLLAVLNIQPGEGQVVFLLLALAACFGLTRLLVQTSAGTLFLLAYDTSALPYVYIGVALVVPALSFIYARLETRLSFASLLLVNVGGQLTGLALLWVGLELGWNAAAFFMPIWFELIWVMTSLALWSLAGRLFDLRQGKRLFSLINAGMVAAAILGGFLVPGWVEQFGTVSLVLMSVLALVVAWFLVLFISRRFAAQITLPPTEEEDTSAPGGTLNPYRRYMRLLMLLAMLSFASFLFIDNIFYGQVETRFASEAELAGFLGPFWAVVNVLMLINSLFLVSQITARFGVGATLMVLPTLTLLTAAALVASGVILPDPLLVIFWLAVVNNLFDWSFRESFHITGLLILYQPLPVARRVSVQTTVEGVGQPIAQGLAGLGLLALGALGVQVLGLNLVLAFMLFMGLFVAVRLSRDYVTMLIQALVKRKLGVGQIVYTDSTSITFLRQGLHDPHPGAAIYSLLMLLEMAPPTLADDLAQALHHPAPEVRRELLLGLERLKLTDAAATVRPLTLTEPAPEVRGMAWRVLASLDPAHALTTLRPHLDSAEPAVRSEVMVGLWRHGGAEGVALVTKRLEQMVHAPEVESRVLAARVIGAVADERCLPQLEQLLADGEAVVRRAALPAAGVLAYPGLWPTVIAGLADHETQDASAAALVQAGSACLPAVAQALDAPHLIPLWHRRLIRLVGRIGGPAAIVLLRAQLQTHSGLIRHEIIAALRRTHYQATHPDEVASLHQNIIAEVTAIAQTLAHLAVWTKPTTLLHTALTETLNLSRHSLLLLLACLYDARVMTQVQDSLAQPDKHAFGLEVLDNVLAQGLKPLVLPVLDDLEPAECLARLGGLARPRRDEAESGRELAAADENQFGSWVRTCAAYALNADQERTDTMLSIIERVLILKTVDIFAGTPDSTLAEIAALLREMELPAGETLFHKADPGQCMYIIVAGRLRVHDGDYLLNYLGERAIVGEMAVLDASPRMASVTATEETQLLRLDQEVLYELMADRPEVARGIIHVLSEHLRARVQTIAELTARLEGVTQGPSKPLAMPVS